MFSTPLIASSRGAATVAASVSALAPGKLALITTVGGAISGYSDTGKPGYDTSPTMTIRIDKTLPKIGRSMKKCGKRIRPA